MNVTFGLIEDSSHSPVRDKQVRRQQMVDRALAAIDDWKRAAEDGLSESCRFEGEDGGATSPLISTVREADR